MARADYNYVIVGGGLAGASAIAGIREVDTEGRILLIGAESHLPYDRPPLTKKLWLGKQTLAAITLHDRAWYEGNGVELRLGVRVKELDAANNRLLDDRGDEPSYEKLLIATGGTPRLLDIPGGGAEGVCYYRTVDDYLATRARAEGGRAAVVVGGGFIGSELAAGLHTIGAKVTMVIRGIHLVPRVFPEGLGSALQANYQQRGITILAVDGLTSIDRGNGGFVARTRKGHQLKADVLVVGIGIAPSTALAQLAGLSVDDGIVVNQYLETSRPGVYAAGEIGRAHV